MAIVAFCRDEHPNLLNDARYASAFVRGRNDYATVTTASQRLT